MSTASTPTHIAHTPPRSNGLGVAGFIVSLVGILTCGILSPLGLLFSLLALFKSPRGMAFAGAILGALGTAFLALAGYGIVTGILWGRDVGNTFVTASTISDAAGQIEAHRTQHGAYPTSDEAQQLIGAARDAWGNPVQYTLVADDQFTLTAPGADGQIGTKDDISYDSATDTFHTPRGDFNRGEIRDAIDKAAKDVGEEAARRAAEEAAKQQGAPPVPDAQP